MNVPKLRFKEFNDEWIEEKINELVELNPKNPSLPDKFIYIDLESVSNGILLQEKIINKTEAPSRAQRNVKINDILYQTVRPYQKNNLFIDKLNTLPYIASTGYAILREKNIYQKFLFNKLHTDNFVNEVLDNCTGTSYPAINSNDLGNLKIHYPPNIKEQKKIGDFLSLLDKKIELQTKKIEDLKLFKLCISNKFFNKNIKEIKSPLNNYCKLYTAKSKINMMNPDGCYYIMDMGTITSDGYILKSKPTFCNEDVIKEGELVMPKDDIGGGLIIGKTGYIDENEKYILGDHVYLLKTENINSLFLHYQINSQYINRQLKKKVTGSAQLGLKASNIINQEIFIYSNEMQNRISKILSLCDNKIKNEIKKIERLMELKKGLMQNMFV